MKRTAIAVLIGLTLLATACKTPKLEGDGVLKDAYVSKVPVNLKPGELHIIPDEKLIFCETTGPYHYFLFYDLQLRHQRTIQFEIRKLALAPDGESAAGLGGKGIQVISLDEVGLTHDVIKPASAILPAAWIGALPAGDGWVVSSGDPSGANVWLVTGERPRFGASGRTELSSQVRARAIDGKTGYLVITGHGNKAEIFDLAEMKSVAVLDLPCKQVSYGLAVGDGVAWVGTAEGSIVPVDLEKMAVGEAFKFGAGPGDVDISLAPSGKTMAVTAQDRRQPNQPFPTSLRVFSVGKMKLKEIARGFLELHGGLDDVEIIEKAKIVAFTCDGGLFGWYFAEKP